MKQQQDPELTVFVAKVPEAATDDELRAFFAPCGAIASLSLPRDRATGRHKGIAFVCFKTLAGLAQVRAPALFAVTPS